MILLAVGAALVLSGGASALLLRRRPALSDRVYATLLVSGCAVGVVAAGFALRPGAVEGNWIPGAATGADWAVGLDPLSAWFLLAILGVGAFAGLYGVGYLAVERAGHPSRAEHAERAHPSVAGAHALFATLVTAMVGVVAARGMFSFLVAWEVMALSAYLLVMHEHRDAQVRRAGFIYLVLTHVSTLALLAMFAALRGPAADGSFAALAAGSAVGSAGAASRPLILALALAGFGIKAGAVPGHFWLPGAHAAAPSHVSALLSGVMLKVGIYGLIRVLWLLGAPPAWLGWTLLAVGLASGILGVLWALGQHDLKRLLAYSSVENIGIILLALGVGVLGGVYGAPAVAVLGYAGALLHTLNHAVFKSLLFLGAGAVLRATGTRELDRLGGLGRAMPWTALAFGVGAAAIVGLPPLNGFVSEWVIFQGLLTASQHGGALVLLVAAVAALGLIGALALACFTRAAGVVFLGQPRHEVPLAADNWWLVGPMLAIASMSIVIGLAPAVAMRSAMAVVGYLSPQFGVTRGPVADTLAGAAATVSWVWGAVVAAGVLLWMLRRRVARAARPAAGEGANATWGCGYALPTSAMQYTASSFSSPLLLAYGRIAAPRVERTATELRTRVDDRVLSNVVSPLWERMRTIAKAFRPLQQGPVTRYLQYIVATVIVMLSALLASIWLVR